MKLAYWLPISWSDYLKLPLMVRHVMFNALEDVRRDANSMTGQARQDRKLGLESH